MCQAYDAEYRFIVHSENRATIKGFFAAQDGVAKQANPFGVFESYEHNAWDHGYSCYKECLLPWAIERLFSDVDRRQKLHDDFARTGKFPVQLRKKIE